MKRLVASAATLLAVASLWPSSRSERGPSPPRLDPRHPGMVLVPAGPFVMGLSEEEAESAQRAYGGHPSFYLASVPRAAFSHCSSVGSCIPRQRQ